MGSELHLIIGPMFSGKTTELLKIAKRHLSINLKVLLINYYEDTRYSSTEMKTHDNDGIQCRFINNLLELDYLQYDIICINEAQFFTNLVEFCKNVLKKNKIIYVNGLDGDYKQEKFGEVLDLIPLCDSVLKLKAYCKVCKNGNLAPFTKRIIDSNEQKLIGTNEYMPVCRKHLI